MTAETTTISKAVLDVGDRVSTIEQLMNCPDGTKFHTVNGHYWQFDQQNWADRPWELDIYARRLPSTITSIPWEAITDPELRNRVFLRALFAANHHPVGRYGVNQEALDLLADFAEAQRNAAFESEAACA